MQTSPFRNVTLSLLMAGFGMKVALLPTAFLDAAHLHGGADSRGCGPQRRRGKGRCHRTYRFLPLRFALPHWGGALTVAGLCGAFYGVAVGITETNPKTVLAYSSVSQMGFLAAVLGMGLAAGDKSVAPIAAFYAAHHVLVKGALFLAVGVAGVTASQRIGIVVVPGVVIALGLAGLRLPVAPWPSWR